MRLWNTIRGAYLRAIRRPHNGSRVVITRPDLAGLRGHVFNPFPGRDGLWTVMVDDPYDLERWPAYQSGFQDLYRWDFVLVEHDVKSWDEIKMEEAMAWHKAAMEEAA